MCPETTQIAEPNPNAGITLVLWPDGTWCWGDDFNGQIGDGMASGTENNPRPVAF